jgi:hypothetical protein
MPSSPKPEQSAPQRQRWLVLSQIRAVTDVWMQRAAAHRWSSQYGEGHGCRGLITLSASMITMEEVLGSENRIQSPNTRFSNKSHKSSEKETRNLQKSLRASKVVNLSTRVLAPPFIGQRRDFLHPENTLVSREYS